LARKLRAAPPTPRFVITPSNGCAKTRSLESSAAAAAPNVYLQQSQTALGAGDYEKAAAALISAQQQADLSAQQAEAVAAQMRQLQSSLASGVASGDPKAKAAADKLRQSATVR
jgi:hypothetical protein